MSERPKQRLRRGALSGLALLFCAAPVFGDASYLGLKRQLRDYSFIVIRDGKEQRILFLDDDVPASAATIPDVVRDEDTLVELAEAGGPFVVSELAAALDDPSRSVRVTAIQLLGAVDSIEARMALEPVLSSSDVELRLEVVEAIADTPGAEPLLELAGDNDSESVSATAHEYLADRSHD